MKNSGFAAGGLFTLGLSSSLLSGCNTGGDSQEARRDSTEASGSHHPFGIQLWTLRDVFPSDPAAILRELASFGYTEIESFDGPRGMFWGMGAAGFEQTIADLGMKLKGSHVNIFDEFEKKVEEAASTNIKYLVCPWIGGQDSLDAYRRMAERFNECGEICKKAGIQFAYHNHEYTFEQMDGIYPQDLLMTETDPDLVEYEIDIYWVVTAKANPEYWIKKYPGRFTLSHVKDRADVPASELRASTTLGTGIIDMKSVLQTAKDNGMKHFFVEQEEYEGTTPMRAAEDGAAYMKELRLS